MISLIKSLRCIYPISEAFRNRLEDTVQYRVLRRNEYLLRAGQICSKIYFVESGILRVYYTIDEVPITSSISFEGQYCLSFASFFEQKYGVENIRAIEDTRVWYITYEDYKTFAKEFPEFNAICRILLEKCHQSRDERMIAMWMQTSEERYVWLVKQWPYIHRLLAKDICSYLGVSEAMVSKIKSKLRGQKSP